MGLWDQGITDDSNVDGRHKTMEIRWLFVSNCASHAHRHASFLHFLSLLQIDVCKQSACENKPILKGIVVTTTKWRGNLKSTTTGKYPFKEICNICAISNLNYYI